MRTILPPKARLVPPQAKRVFKGMIYDVYHWQQQMFDGSHETFEMLKRPDTLWIIAIKDGKIITSEEEQPGREPFYGIPGGRHDHDNETELQAAQRELREETGLSFASWRLLDVHQPNGKMDYFVYTYLATDFLNQIDPQLDAGEKVKAQLRSLEEVKLLLNDPKTRFLPKIFEEVESIDELLALPEYQGIPVIIGNK